MNEASESYKNGKVYKHRYKSGRRPEPKRCPVIKKDGTQCRNNVVVGYRVCMAHGGRAAKARITHGLTSKLIRSEYMRAIKALTDEERRELLGANYSKDSLFEDSLMMSDAMITRLVKHQTELIERYNQAVQDLGQMNNPGSRDIEVATANINALSKQITDLSKVIQIHQAQMNATLKTKKELKDKNENEDTLKQLSAQLDTDPKELIGDLIKAYLQANPQASVDELLQLKAADIPVEYELSDDD